MCHFSQPRSSQKCPARDSIAKPVKPTRRTIHRATMVYKWDQHRDTLYRLYVEEKLSLEEVVQHMREHHDFTPRCV